VLILGLVVDHTEFHTFTGAFGMSELAPLLYFHSTLFMSNRFFVLIT